ncbi:hypothetical protein [Prosthecobacter sp.]|jgi:hypothetical protein|uniref:hypothetical protein n=1 Tax=Prosthecobacter sp. TaxID=1965333 RepID=UPI003783BE59
MNRFTESFLGERLGDLGSWTVRLLSLGFYKPDPESWAAIGIGFFVLIGAVVYWKL